MKRVLLGLVRSAGACSNDSSPSSPTSTTPVMGFFVTGAIARSHRGRINGQWTGSPTLNQHDILTGSNADGSLLPGFTCADWTSSATTDVGQVGHADGLGPGQSTAGALASWNSAHANQNCADTAPRGGGGRFYCFAR